MMQIHLQNVPFFAFHGLYEEERILGSHFEVNIRIDTDPHPMQALQIGDTIDYCKVYEMLEIVMKKPTELLENIAITFCRQVLKDFPSAMSISFQIRKINPPIKGMRGHVAVHYELHRSEL